MTATGVERCVTCGNEVTTRFCAHCGEKRASDRSYSTWEFIKEHVVESVMSFDGRVIRTFKTLVRKPGELTAEFMRGVRLPYLPPIQAFLIFNLVYFLWSGATQSNTFNTTYHVHLSGMPYSATAKRLVRQRLVDTQEPEKVYAARFNAIGSAQSRSLVMVMVPAFALFVAAFTLSRRRRLPLVQHLVFSLHTYAFLFFMLPAAAYVVDWPLSKGLAALGVEEGPYGYDSEISVALLLIILGYLVLSLRRAYEMDWRRAIEIGFLCVLSMMGIVSGYRALLFFVTFWST